MRAGALAGVFLTIDLAFFGTNVIKSADGGWVPPRNRRRRLPPQRALSPDATRKASPTMRGAGTIGAFLECRYLAFPDGRRGHELYSCGHAVPVTGAGRIATSAARSPSAAFERNAHVFPRTELWICLPQSKMPTAPVIIPRMKTSLVRISFSPSTTISVVGELGLFSPALGAPFSF